jgi:hypothetical protein
MTENKNRPCNQQIPEDYNSEKISGLSESVGIIQLFLGKHKISVYHEEKRYTETAKIVNGIVDHTHAVKSYNTKAGDTFY